MTNSENPNQTPFKNKHALVFDNGTVVVVHGDLTVELSGAEQTEKINLEDVPDTEFQAMMDAPNDFKITSRKSGKTLKRK